jgi:hypothetical protein
MATKKKAAKKAAERKRPVLKVKHKKAKPKAATKPKAASAKGKNAHAAATGRHTAPANAPLPGFEQIRDRVLDRLCESIGTQREVMNEAKQIERSDIGAALSRMVGKDTTIYKHHGVELIRVPGADKLRVRLTKDDAGTAAGEGVDDDAPEPEFNEATDTDRDTTDDAAGDTFDGLDLDADE